MATDRWTPDAALLSEFPMLTVPYGSLVNYSLKAGEMGSGWLELIWWYDGPICHIRRLDGRLVKAMLDCGDQAEAVMV